jgi:hypothetical protein
MTKLTIALARKAIRWNHKVDQKIDLDEEGKIIVCTTHGWMFPDGTMTMGFNLQDFGNSDPADTLAYFQEQMRWIVSNPDEQ